MTTRPTPLGKGLAPAAIIFAVVAIVASPAVAAGAGFAGQVLFTGILGDREDAEPGRYVAGFGALGSLTFELK